MDGDLFVRIIIILMGIAFLAGSIFYRKKDHEKVRRDSTLGNYSDSFIASVIGRIIGIFLQLVPWWIPKILIFIIGVAVIYLGIFL